MEEKKEEEKEEVINKDNQINNKIIKKEIEDNLTEFQYECVKIRKLSDKILASLYQNELTTEGICQKIGLITPKDYDSIRRTINRTENGGLIADGFVETTKSTGTKKIYSLTQKGTNYVYFEYQKWQQIKHYRMDKPYSNYDYPEIISKLRDFIEENYLAKILKNLQEGKQHIIIDFKSLMGFDPAFADNLLDDSENMLNAFKNALDHFELPKNINKGQFMFRFENFPESLFKRLGDIGVEDINKLLIIEGEVKQKTDRNGEVYFARFECPSCGNIIGVNQDTDIYKEPTRCGCGRKGLSRLIETKKRNKQIMQIAEPIDLINNSRQPRKRYVILYNDLTDKFEDEKTNPGARIILIGLVKSRQKQRRDGKISVDCELEIIGNNFINTDKSFYDLTYTEEEVIKFRELSKNPELDKLLRNSIFYDHFGDDDILDAVIIQLFGADKKSINKKRFRDKLNILMIGDPGVDKTGIIKRACEVAIKSKFAVGTSSSGAGLTATVVKDKFLDQWTLEGGVLPSANKGLAGIDEIEKSNKEDLDKLHEPMEDGQIHIHKATIHADILADCDILASCNPKFGRFNSYENIYTQIFLSPTIINRFDLIFTMKDTPEQEKDRKVARMIMGCNEGIKLLDFDFIRKYIAFTKQTIIPKLPSDIIDRITKYYTETRQNEDIKSFNARQLQAIIRLSLANARKRMSTIVEVCDFDKAINLIILSLKSVAVDTKTGKIDIDRITTGFTESQRQDRFKIKDIIEILNSNYNDKLIPVWDIIREAKKNKFSEKEADNAIDMLKKEGWMFEAKPGFVKLI